MAWDIWTDGSCVYDDDAREGGLGHGGWAARVEHGSDGVALRGRVAQTTNVRMEMVAATEALRLVPTGEQVLLHTDCTVIVSVDHARRKRSHARERRDKDLWVELAAELARVVVRIDLLVKGKRPPAHKTVHAMAGAEARALQANLPANATYEDLRRAKSRRKQTAAGPRHTRECLPGACVLSCPVWLKEGAAVYASRRGSESRRAV